MNWSSWSQFAAMGGSAFHVWGSFGMVALAIVAECLALRSRRLRVDRAAQP